MTTAIKTMSFLCIGCNGVFVIPSRRGRPPKFCDSCREPVKEPKWSKIEKIEKIEKAPQKSVQEQIPVTMMSCFCTECNEIFAIPSRRGRPPKFCERCTQSGAGLASDEKQRAADRIRANARVDHLEMLLRSRGTHISQHAH